MKQTNPLTKVVRAIADNKSQNQVKTFLERELYTRANRVLDRQKVREAKTMSEGVVQVSDVDTVKSRTIR